MSEALSHSHIILNSIPLSNYIYILNNRIIEGLLAKWGYIFNWQKDSEVKSHKEKGRENLFNLYIILVLLKVYNAYKYIKSN